MFSQFCRIVFPIILIVFNYPVFGDIVVLKSGEIIEDVKSFVLLSTVNIINSSGKEISYPKKDVKNIKFKPVIWKPKQKQPDYEELLRVTQEQNKFNEYLQQELESVKQDVGDVKKEVQQIGQSQNTWQFTWRSMIIPGWGQYHSKAEFKGISCFVFGLYSFNNSVRSYQSFKKAQQNYDNAFVVFGDGFVPLYLNLQYQKEQLSNKESVASNAYFLFLGFWIFQVLETRYISGPDAISKDKQVSYDFNFGIRNSSQSIYTFNNNEIFSTLKINWRF